MSFYPVTPCDVTCSSAEGAALGLLGQAGMVTVAVADLASPCRAGLGKDGRTALIAAGAGQIRSGELVVWLKPVVITPAVVRRDGRVQAAGRPAGHARLGLAEHALDELCGTPDVIGQVAAAAVAGEKVRGAARRAVTAALAIRFTLLMTLMGDADYAEVMDTLLGDLLLVPWQQPCRAPVAASACAWRKALGPAPLEQLRDMALAGIDAEHRDHDYRAVTVGDLDAGSIDGSLIRVPDTPASREAFGSAGPPMTARRTRSCGSCGSATPPPAPPWRWSPGRLAPRQAEAETRARPSRCCWTRPWKTIRRCSRRAGSGSWTGTSPASRG